MVGEADRCCLLLHVDPVYSQRISLGNSPMWPAVLCMCIIIYRLCVFVFVGMREKE